MVGSPMNSFDLESNMLSPYRISVEASQGGVVASSASEGAVAPSRIRVKKGESVKSECRRRYTLDLGLRACTFIYIYIYINQFLVFYVFNVTYFSITFLLTFYVLLTFYLHFYLFLTFY